MDILPVVVGTAGHIDHGKSTLVRALTGIDPDRLKEERERGLTIDLGFANFALPDGRRVGIVDVPGHERFVANMVAGATGIDLVVLVVAADDGVMPQTREHLDIMRLLGLRHGLVALTKIDAVDPELVELATGDVRALLAGTFLEDAGVFPVSGVTGEGVEALRDALCALAAAAEPKSDAGVFRMPVQRVFTKQGFGSVLTGIPLSGHAGPGDELELLPAGVRSRVRGVQAYGEKAARARAGHSSALNLPDVPLERAHRGDVVATPGYFRATRLVAARLQALDDLPKPLRDRSPVRLHVGTADPAGELVLLDVPELAPGGEALVQFRLDEAVVVAPGDRFVVRRLSPERTLGGGVVLEPSEHRLKRFKQFVIQGLAQQEESLGSPASLLEATLARRGLEPATEDDLARAVQRDRAEVRALLAELAERGAVVAPAGGQRYLHTDALDFGLEKLAAASAAWFEEHPQRLHVEALELGRRTGLARPVLDLLVREAVARGRFADAGQGRLVPADRTVEADPELDRAHARLVEAGLRPPPPAELAEALGMGERKLRPRLDRLVDEGRAARVGPDYFLADAAYAQARDAIVANCERNGRLEIAELREVLDTTRKWLIPLLEHFDAIGLTVRQGSYRILKPR